MAKNGTAYKKRGGIYHPLTNTHQVLNPDGTRLEQRLQDEEQAVRGKGEKASAHEYPMRYLGTYSNITALNAALNEIFHTTDPHWQGSLRAHMSGQVIFVSQMALNFSIGDWAQVVTGMVAPSQDGTALVRSNTPGIYWRSRETQGESVVSHQWQSLSSLVLKTVNGQSLIGGGDITISAGGTVPIDDELDETSQHAIANAAVAKAVGELWDAIDALPDAAEGGVLVCKKWGNDYVAFSEGDYAYDPLQAAMYKYTSGAWEYQGYPKEGVIYINAPAQSSHYWNGTAMVGLLGEVPVSAINVNSSAPVNSKAVADYVEKEKKVVKLTYWGNLSQDANIGEYGYDTNDNKIYLYTDTVNPQGDWEDLGMPKEDVLYLRGSDSAFFHFDGDEMIAMIDKDKMVPSIPETGGESVFPTAAGVKSYVDGKDAAMKTYVDNAVANIEPSGEGGSSSARGWGEPDFQDPYRPEYYLTAVKDGQTVNVRDHADLQAAVKWGIPFYDWPLRCYNGSDTYDTYESSASDVEVTAPSERIIHKYGMTMAATSDNVVFDTGLKAFVLEYNGHIYKRWANDYEWNDISDLNNIKARKDVVFSDISLETDTDKMRSYVITNNVPQAKRVTYVFDNDGQETLADIATLMTDFTEAFSKCQAFSLNKDNGKLYLSDRIYYIGNWHERRGSSDNYAAKIYAYDLQTETQTLDNLFWSSTRNQLWPRGDDNAREFYTGPTTINKDGYTIDGGNGVLFIRSSMMGFPINYCTRAAIAISLSGSNGIVRNLRIKALRDRDNCIDPARRNLTNQALSCSDSCLDAFSLGGGHDILIENVDIQGCNHDFFIAEDGPTRVTIKKWKSRDGWQNAIRSNNIYFLDCDYKQRDWAGAGMHVFYYQQKARNIFYSNCKFEMGKYSNAGFDLAIGSILESSVPRDIHFESCELIGCSIFTGSGIGSTWVYAHGCHIRQNNGEGTYISGTTHGLTTAPAISIKKTKWSFSNCLFSLINRMASGADSGARIDMVDCGIDSESSETLISLTKIYGNRISTNGSLGATIVSTDTIIDDVNNLKEGQSELEREFSEVGVIRKVLTGTEYTQVENENDLPEYGEPNDKYYVLSTGKVKGNPHGGVVAKSCYQFSGTSSVSDGDVVNTMAILTLGRDEKIKIPLSINSSTTTTDIINAIRNELYANGYRQPSAGQNIDTDWVGLYLQNGNYLAVGSMHVGSGNDRNNEVLNEAGFRIQAITSKNITGCKNLTAGVACIWDDISEENDGLISRVSSLETKVMPDTPLAGRTDDRPDPAEVGPGYCFFDLQLGTSGKAIFSTGSGWVYADGTAVS